MKIIVLIIGYSFLFSQFPVDLNPDEITEPFNLFVESDTEFILTISASTNTDWSIMNGESSTLVVIVDGESDNYNQDVVLYAGQYIHNYNCSLGHLENGDHTIEFIFDSEKSSILAEWIHIESIELTDISTLLIDEDAFRAQWLTNVEGPLMLTRLALPLMGSGARILHIGSGAAHHQMPGASAYGMTKKSLYEIYQYFNRTHQRASR